MYQITYDGMVCAMWCAPYTAIYNMGHNTMDITITINASSFVAVGFFAVVGTVVLSVAWAIHSTVWATADSDADK